MGQSLCEEEKSGRGKPKHFINSGVAIELWKLRAEGCKIWEFEYLCGTTIKRISVRSYLYRADSPTHWDTFIYLLQEKLTKTNNKPETWWHLCVRREGAPKPSKVSNRSVSEFEDYKSIGLKHFMHFLGLLISNSNRIGNVRIIPLFDSVTFFLADCTLNFREMLKDNLSKYFCAAVDQKCHNISWWLSWVRR
jgi:hypothetical protein